MMSIEKQKTGIELIAQERAEQIEKHGRTLKEDVKINSNYQLVDAARLLLQKHIEGRVYEVGKEVKGDEDDSLDHIFKGFVPDNWNEEIWNKMFDKPYKERMIIAGALIAAEIDRMNSKV